MLQWEQVSRGLCSLPADVGAVERFHNRPILPKVNGSAIDCISPKFADFLGLTIHELAEPYRVSLANDEEDVLRKYTVVQVVVAEILVVITAFNYGSDKDFRHSVVPVMVQTRACFTGLGTGNAQSQGPDGSGENHPVQTSVRSSQASDCAACLFSWLKRCHGCLCEIWWCSKAHNRCGICRVH